MKSKTFYSKAICAGALVAWIVGATAQEQTGKVIERLFVEVDKKLTDLETQSQKANPERAQAKLALEAEVQQYHDAESELAKQAIRSSITEKMINLNQMDAREVKGTLDTVSNVIGILDRLKKAVKTSPQFNPKVLEEQQKRMGSFVRNAAEIVKMLDTMDSKYARQTAGMKQTLGMLYKQLNHPVYGGGGALERVSQTVLTLEEVAKQMLILQNLLGQEKTLLTTATHTQMVDMALVRLASISRDGKRLTAIPASMQKDLLDRSRGDVGKIISEGPSGALNFGGDDGSEETFDDFEAIFRDQSL